MRLFIEEPFRINFKRVIHIIDSQIVKPRKDSYGFNTFVATRVGEIQTKTSPEEWYWVESRFNEADLIARGADIKEMGIHSTSQNGPQFLALPVSEWPLHLEHTPYEELPERIGYAFASAGILRRKSVIDIDRFSNYMRLIRVTARILPLCTPNAKYSLSNMGATLTPRDLMKAKVYWENESQIAKKNCKTL